MKTYLIAAFLFLAGYSVTETQNLPSNTEPMPTHSTTVHQTALPEQKIKHSELPYVPPRGPTYGAAAVVSRKFTQGKIPYGSSQRFPARPAARP